MTSKTDADRYDRLLDTGVKIVQEACKSLTIPVEDLAARAGCMGVEDVRKFFETGKAAISGRDWERLITFCVLPELWVYRANVVPPADYQLISGAGAADKAPSESTTKKLRDVLSTSSWFYQEATKRFLALDTPAL